MSLLIELPSPDHDRLRCVMSLRGFNIDAYGDFNVCHYVGDTSEHVAASRRMLADELGLDVNSLVIPRQTHSLNVEVVNDTDSGRTYEDTDALVTDKSGIALCINTADCVPIILADLVHGVIGIAHSGWRGTVGKIVARTVDVMMQLGASPSDINAIIGACICQNCFEVGDEVALQFKQAFPHEKNNIVLKRFPKPHIDLVEAIRVTLAESGISQAHISSIGVCSRCGSLPLFSARRDGIYSGRTVTAVMLR